MNELFQIRTRFNPELWPMELQSQFSNDGSAPSEHERHPLVMASPEETHQNEVKEQTVESPPIEDKSVDEKSVDEKQEEPADRPTTSSASETPSTSSSSSSPTSDENLEKKEDEDWQEVKPKRNKKEKRHEEPREKHGHKNRRGGGSNRAHSSQQQHQSAAQSTTTTVETMSEKGAEVTENSEEMSDHHVNKLIIVTQFKNFTKPKNEGNNKRGGKARLDDEMEHGLRRYEEILWETEGRRASVPSQQTSETQSESSSNSGDTKSPPSTSVWIQKAKERQLATMVSK